jgi:hypothetical protein
MRLSGFLDAAADLCESLSGTYQMELGRELMEFSMPDRLDPTPMCRLKLCAGGRTRMALTQAWRGVWRGVRAQIWT